MLPLSAQLGRVRKNCHFSVVLRYCGARIFMQALVIHMFSFSSLMNSTFPKKPRFPKKILCFTWLSSIFPILICFAISLSSWSQEIKLGQFPIGDIYKTDQFPNLECQDRTQNNLIEKQTVIWDFKFEFQVVKVNVYQYQYKRLYWKPYMFISKIL